MYLASIGSCDPSGVRRGKRMGWIIV